MSLTTHVLDTSLGKPVAGVSVALSVRKDGRVSEIARAVTDADGRVRGFLPEPSLLVGVYQLTFETAAYFRAAGRDAFFERVTLEFYVAEPSEHYHVPLLVTPYGYSTYRGS